MIKKSDIETQQWNTWLAGVIDGDGYFYISKAGSAQFELTTGVEDQRMLLSIQAEIGGQVKSRAGAEAIRLRIHKKDLIINLLHRVNGHIRNPKRWPQFIMLCQHFGIHAIPAQPLTDNCCYIAGLFDADGSILISVSKASANHSILPGVQGKRTRLTHSKGYNQLTIKITSSFKDYLVEIQQALGFGSIVEQGANKLTRNPRVVYYWYCSNREHCLRWQMYINKCCLRSSKQKRMLLLAKYFEIKEKKYHLSNPTTGEFLVWQKFCTQWWF
uniref:Homing endonuclease LAGLIDADG domain-containing protein n=1 Tax=Ulva sp. TM708 TaxID=2496873 RepID=A0A7R6SBR4_9CHLO|nr:hypothetical protein JXX85_mgp15 [Ulva sp. TM708]AZP40150.1 hypothetical protein [Ulva sp. TM708]